MEFYVGSSKAQEAVTGTLVNNGVIITTGTGDAQTISSSGTAKNYGTISAASGAGQSTKFVYNYGTIKGTTGQAINGKTGKTMK